MRTKYHSVDRERAVVIYTRCVPILLHATDQAEIDNEIFMPKQSESKGPTNIPVRLLKLFSFRVVRSATKPRHKQRILLNI